MARSRWSWLFVLSERAARDWAIQGSMSSAHASRSLSTASAYVLPFGDFISGEDDAWPYYTNKKFWKMMQPTSEKLPYTYDTFSYPWCSDLGYDWSA